MSCVFFFDAEKSFGPAGYNLFAICISITKSEAPGGSLRNLHVGCCCCRTQLLKRWNPLAKISSLAARVHFRPRRASRFVLRARGAYEEHGFWLFSSSRLSPRSHNSISHLSLFAVSSTPPLLLVRNYALKPPPEYRLPFLPNAKWFAKPILK